MLFDGIEQYCIFISNSTTEDSGRKLENLVFLHLRRKYKELYYFDEKGECDFVAMQKGSVCELIQVCYELTPDNIKRELDGLKKAMQFFNLSKAKIVTFGNSDLIKLDKYEVEVIPAYRYLSE